MPAYGKVKVDTITYDLSGTATDVSVSNIATKASPTFTGTVTVPTPSADDNSTKAASTAYVQTELGDYALKAGPTFTGTVNAADLVLSGDLTVNGSTTTIDTTTLQVEDKNVVIGKVSTPSDATADGGGWTLKGATDKTFNWVNATDAWTSSEHIHLLDNKKLFVGGASGTTDGLEIYHSGSHSNIKDAGTGQLNLWSNTFQFYNAAGNKTSMKIVEDAQVELYYDNSKKLETASGGVTVTGTLAATAVTGDGSGLTNLPPGGNSIDLVADGAIAAGKAVIIKSNGKAEQVGESVQATNTAVATSGNGLGNIGFSPIQSSNASAYDPASDLMAYAFRDSSDDLKVRLYSTSGTGFSQEAETTVDTDAANNYWGIGVLSGKRFAVVYKDATRTRIRILPVNSSNDGFDTLGSETNLDGQSNGNSYRDVAITETTTGRVVVLTKGGNSDSRFDDKLGVIIGDVSGTTWTYRNSAQIGTDTPDEFWSIDYDSTNGVLGVTYDMSNGNCKMVGLKIAAGDGAAVTAGTILTLQSSGSTGANQIRYHSNSGSWITAWRSDSNAQDVVKTRAHTINSSTLAITSGTEVAYTFQGRPHYALDINISDQHHIYFTWVNQAKYGYTLSATVSGTTLTHNSSDITTNILSSYGTTIQRLGTHYMSHNGKLAHFGKGDGQVNDVNFSATATITSTASNLTTNNQNFLGFAEDAISDGSTGTIKLEGNVVGNQSGLTPGTFYAVNGAGVLSSGGSAYSCGGLAVASDKLRIKDVQKS